MVCIHEVKFDQSYTVLAHQHRLAHPLVRHDTDGLLRRHGSRRHTRLPIFTVRFQFLLYTPTSCPLKLISGTLIP